MLYCKRSPTSSLPHVVGLCLCLVPPPPPSGSTFPHFSPFFANPRRAPSLACLHENERKRLLRRLFGKGFHQKLSFWMDIRWDWGRDEDRLFTPSLACERAPGEDGKKFRRARNRRIRRAKRSGRGPGACSQATASLFTHAKEKASAASAKHSRIRVVPRPLPSQVFRFALASSSLAILSARSTIECEQPKTTKCWDGLFIKLLWGCFNLIKAVCFISANFSRILANEW